jgi:hypothetical protein
MSSLGTRLPAEITRVRDEVLPAYLEIGQAGAFAASMMRRELDLAVKALAEGDIAAMITAFHSLKGFEL